MPESRQITRENIGATAEVLCEQCLPRVFKYVAYWVNNTQLAEDLTLKVINSALADYPDYVKHEDSFLVAAFIGARSEIQDYLRAKPLEQALHNLSHQEQEVISLKQAGGLDNVKISRVLGLPESDISSIVYQSLCQLKGCLK